MDKRKAIEEIFRLSKSAGISSEELLEGLKEFQQRDQSRIPLDIFSGDLGIIEAIVKHLKENHGLKFSQIGKTLSRNPKSVWLSYRKSQQKHPEGIIPSGLEATVPISIFHEDLLGALEALVVYLRDSEEMTNAEVAKALGRDHRTIWATYSKAKKKKE